MTECKHHLGFHDVEYEENCCRICGESKYEISLKAEVARLRADVRLAFYEGFDREYSICPDVSWDRSAAKRSLQEDSDD
jgi:hypothetical protein